MIKQLTSNIFLAVIVSLSFTTTYAQTDTKSAELISALEAVNGGWETLSAKQDVQFTYVYDDYAKGKEISTERYIFDGEASYAEYAEGEHPVNAMPGMEGAVVQSYVNGKPAVSVDGKSVDQPEALGGTQFLRAANYHWFTMMYKLGDPGTNHEYLGKETIDGIEYDKVMLTYDADETGKEANDSYVLYFNPETRLVDQFYFSLPAMGVNDPVLKMELDYTEVDGVYVATTRRGVFPNPETGEYVEAGEYTSEDVTFDNGFSEEDLMVE